MGLEDKTKNMQKDPAYLTMAGAWALAFGCAVGWGSFMMPGNTFLPIAGPIGTFIGMFLGAFVMIVIAANFHYLMNKYPDAGGTYTYTKKCFGYDHGLLSAWFLVLTYIAIIWANASAIPLVARTLLGGIFQFGFHYQVAGFDVYAGEVMLAVLALLISAAVCLRRKAAEMAQIVMAAALFGGIVICLIAAVTNTGLAEPFKPAFSPDHSPISGTFTIFALAPWAYVGFESITHSAAESKFDLKHSFKVMVIALITAGAAYAFLALIAVTALPEGCASWVEYIQDLGSYSGVQSAPTFNAAYTALGNTGSLILGVAALCGMFTGLLGNYIALSRLISALADDGMVSGWLGKRNSDNVPMNAIYSALGISVIFPFLGRTAISWIVDVTTVGATIAYAFASASAWKTAKDEGNGMFKATGFAGMIVSVLFAVEFLIPNLTMVQTLSTESYLILATWGILGFLVFRYMLIHQDKNKLLGRSSIAWIVLLGLIIFTSSVWMLQATDIAITNTLEQYQVNYSEQSAMNGSGMSMYDYLFKTLAQIDATLARNVFIQVGLIVGALVIMFNIYGITQKRERQTEIEKALAEDASKAKTSFLSNMSHEIRTPMNAIIGLDSIALRNPDLQPQTRDQLEKIGASANHLLGLINDILDMSRIESGRMVLKDEEFSTKELLEQVNIIINGQCQDKGLDYECVVVGKIRDYYFGDNMKLKQVLINILGNSVKFTDVPGKVTLTVEQIAEEDGMSTLSFAMKDTGIGMDEEYIPKIFEAFSQEDATATNRYGGSGLGMAITKNFVEMMNGDIDVKSKKGVGSTFTVTVQLRPSDKVFVEPDKQAEYDEYERDLAGKRVLMAEDVEQNAEILEDLLELEDVTAEHALNGQIAVDMFKQHPAGYYDAILMDVRMPVMDGLTATSTIRALDREDAKDIPIVAMTANVFDEDVEKSIEAGMNAHLAKPVEPEKLYDIMAKLIAEHEKK